jgi:hypothetical protein
MIERSLEKYLISTCLFVIDDFNERYKNFSAGSQELKYEADTCYSEADLVVRIGYPFRQMANFSLKTSKGKEGSFNDIVVKERDFRIEVKYIRNSKSQSKNEAYSVHYNWPPVEEDFLWLIKEIKNGNKGKRAFIIGWFNSIAQFSDQMQLGDGGGRYPLVNVKRMKYFPFLGYDDTTRDMKSVMYNYGSAYSPIPLDLPNLRMEEKKVDCLFLGEPEDKFHFALYY